jgi:flagellar motor switch protein FliG
MAKLKGIEKIAILLAALGKEASSQVIQHLEPDEQERIGHTMLELEETVIEENLISSVLTEFRNQLFSGGSLRTRMGKALEEMMTSVFEEGEAQQRIERIREETKSKHPFRGLRGIKASDLARVLSEEHRQIQALVLANLDSEQAADVLENFPEEEQIELVYRMATMEEPLPRLLKQVASSVTMATRGLSREEGEDPLDSDPRIRVVADLLNATGAGTDKEILEGMEEKDEEMVVRIRERMFCWEDLTLLDNRTMQKVLAGIDTKLLAMALKGTDEDVQESILSATSQRTRDMILEERELIGAVPLSDVLEAQKQILSTIRELVDSGEITMNKGKGAVYVE